VQIKVISRRGLSRNQEAKKMKKKREDKERFFSVELKSKADLKSVTLTNGCRDSVLVEGTIGELVQASFAEGIILEVAGTKGTLRINLEEEELKKALQKAAAENAAESTNRKKNPRR
jgi:hypothetical protein